MNIILAADIGASKVNVASFVEENGKLRLTRFQHYLTKESSGLISLLQKYRAAAPEERTLALAVGVAGPVVEGRDVMTNLSWTINPDDLRDTLGISHVFLLNDLASFGWGVSQLGKEGTEVLQIGKPNRGNQAVIAAGTGLGECTLFKNGNDYTVSASEGGHVDFGPRNEEELALLQFLLKRYRHRVSWERVVSGKFGFRNIFDFLKDTGRAEAPVKLMKDLEGQQEIGPMMVAAALDHIAIAEKTLELFSALYASKAGNLALEVLATEGVYLCGGIAQKLQSWLKTPSFLEAFCNKGRMSQLLKDVPIYLVTDPYIPLKGLAKYAYGKLKETRL